MNIIVLNGSPKGNMSVTMQYVAYVQKNFPKHNFEILNVAQKIDRIEKDRKYFQATIDKIKCADGVLWAFPVYVLLVPSQYIRFVELIFENNVEHVFHDKYSASLSTSIHFYDHAAHNYINSICDDLHMKYTGFFSADMHDLLKMDHRKHLLLFTSQFLNFISEKYIGPKNYDSIIEKSILYKTKYSKHKASLVGDKILVIKDSNNNTNLNAMVDKFMQCFSSGVELMNLSDLNILGGCTGCLKCSFDNVCRYHNKDDFNNFYNEKIIPADTIIFAGAIQNRFLSSLWKQFFDRSFFKTHIPTLINKQIGYMISGPLRQIANLREILDAYTECLGGSMLGFITDEYKDSDTIDLMIEGFAANAAPLTRERYVKPKTFLSVCGMKILRDNVWGRFRFIFQADHRFYKKNGIYDFPQNDLKVRLRNLILMLLTKIPQFKERLANKMKQALVKPYKKYLR